MSNQQPSQSNSTTKSMNATEGRLEESLRNVRKLFLDMPSEASWLEILEQKHENWLQNPTFSYDLPDEISKKSIREIFHQRDNNRRLTLLSSPPDISPIAPDLPSDSLAIDRIMFRSLGQRIQSGLQDEFGNSDSSNGRRFVEYREDIFNDEVQGSQANKVAKELGKELIPFPTLILQSVVDFSKIEITITLTCPKEKVANSQTAENNNDCSFQQFKLPTNFLEWQKLKQDLKIALRAKNDLEKDSNSEQDTYINSQLLELISNTYIGLALFFSDLYCLSVDRSHDPKLFSFLEEKSGFNFASILEGQLSFFKDFLRETQQEENNKIPQGTDNPVNPAAVLLGICLTLLLFLIPFCATNQESPSENKKVEVGQENIEQGQVSYGIIQVDDRGASLRNAPNRNNNSLMKINLKSGTCVILGQQSSDTKFRYVTTPEGEKGWVWSALVVPINSATSKCPS